MGNDGSNKNGVFIGKNLYVSSSVFIVPPDPGPAEERFASRPPTSPARMLPGSSSWRLNTGRARWRFVPLVINELNLGAFSRMHRSGYISKPYIMAPALHIIAVPRSALYPCHPPQECFREVGTLYGELHKSLDIHVRSQFSPLLLVPVIVIYFGFSVSKLHHFLHILHGTFGQACSLASLVLV